MFHHYILSMMHGAIFVEGNSCVFIFLWIFYSLRSLRILLALLVMDFTRFARYGRSTLRPYLGRCVLFVLFFYGRSTLRPYWVQRAAYGLLIFLLFANSFLKYLCYSWVREHHFFELVNCHASFDSYTCCRDQF